MKNRKRDEPMPRVETCPQCGGLHFGSNGCPYNETVCDVCHKTLLQHEGYCFCEGGKTEHNPRQKYCTCETCVASRRAIEKNLRRIKADQSLTAGVDMLPEGEL